MKLGGGADAGVLGVDSATLADIPVVAGSARRGAAFRADRLKTWFRHVACVLALMWTGLVNGQPFFFPDTTNYVRAADAAVFIASGKTISTAWTDRYRAQLPGAATNTAPAVSTRSAVSANDVSSGTIMGGRSPYIGALLYLGYVSGNFWPFVLLQAAIAYFLIVLGLRRFGVDRLRAVLGTTLLLAAATSLPTYNSLLLADAFASFGIVAFLLLATPGALSRLETGLLFMVLAISVTAHLTHIVMLIGMIAMAALGAWVGWLPRLPRRGWVAGIGGIVLGLGSLQLTALATQAAFGRAPQLLPLITARFLADGPGKTYIDGGCDGRRFQVCRLPIPDTGNVPFLFATDPKVGTYLVATPEQRRRMGAEDVGFALAVLRHEPVTQGWMMVRNTVRQLLWIDYDGLNMGCFDTPGCWTSLPPTVRDALRRSPSGRGTWPTELMNAVLYVVVAGSLVVLIVLGRAVAARDPIGWREFRAWLLMGGSAMLVCAFFGGAICEPQYRYQGRLIWLVPFMAAILVFMFRRIGTGEGAIAGSLSDRPNIVGAA